MKLRMMLVAVLAAAWPAAAVAHGPESDGRSAVEALSAHHQHGGSDGHLPPVQRGVELVGKLDLFSEDDERPGRVSDVASFGDHAYLGAFYKPDCEEGGVYVIDISDPSVPRRDGFIPASPGTYVGEGVQVLDLDTPAFAGQVLIHNNENCAAAAAGPLPVGRGGASLWDVTDPRSPQPLAEHVGDDDIVLPGTTHASLPHASHSAFGWQQGDKAFMVTVDNGELGTTDVDIFDITNPATPKFVTETGLPDWTDDRPVVEDPAPNGNNAFLHDMVVKEVDGRHLLLGSYWDGGYVILDVTALSEKGSPKKPTFLRDTDFGAVEPFAAEMGLPANWTPEGNAHQAEFSPDNTMFLGADEDFGAFRADAQITGGPYQGTRFSATQGSNVPQIDEDTTLDGPTTFVGKGCAMPPAPSPEHIAVMERGVCTFTVKAQAAQAAGYAGGIVFNDQATDPDCDAHVYMLAVADIPFMFVGRTTGLQVLEQSFDDPCKTSTPATATLGATPTAGLQVRGVFDGWGYVHLYDAQTMQVLDHWALPESLDPANATGKGDLSVHEVAMDPRRNRAYVSHYAGGFRILDFDRDNGIREVGAYIAPPSGSDDGGNNFWGVEVHDPGRRGRSAPLVLASDRDSGLWIFRATKKKPPARQGGDAAPPRS